MSIRKRRLNWALVQGSRGDGGRRPKRAKFTCSIEQPNGDGLRGGPRRYSDVASEAALTLRLLFRLPWRQTAGLLASISSLLGLDSKAPDRTTLSRRSSGLRVELHRLPRPEPVHLIVDATGLGIVGQGQRGGRKLHIGVAESGRVLVAALTDRAVPDAVALPGLMDGITEQVLRLTAYGGYDPHRVYAAAGARGARLVVPRRRDAVVSGDPVFADRDAHIEAIAEVGRRRWRVEAGQHAQARAENTFFRFKRLFGGRLRGRDDLAQKNEILVGCNILNRMAECGMPNSERVAAG